MREELIKYLEKETKLKLDFDKLLEKPKDSSHGDFSFPCFILSKELKKAPIEISKDLSESLSKNLPNFLEKIVATGPFLNFYLNNSKITENISKDIISGKLFKVQSKNKQTILIEYPSPNTNKSLHLGHLRNILLGNSLCNILSNTNNKIIRTNLNNDRGIAICKAMLGYELFFKDKTPKSEDMKGDKFVEMCYVKLESESKKDESLLDRAQEMLVLWEKGDKKTLDLWKKILDWVYNGYTITHKNLKLNKFDQEYFESELYDKGKEIILKAKKDKISNIETEKDGAIYYDFKNDTYGKKYLLRGDGTTLYMTQDLYLASLKAKQFKADKYVFIVGNEQQYHFEVLFQLLNNLNIVKTENNLHYSYGYVYDRDGNKFSSRKGNVIRCDELYEEVIKKAKKNLLSKELTKNLSEKELDKRSKIIGYAALSYAFLNTNYKNDIKFDMDKALSFEGETGPYTLYTYARIQSLLKKAKYYNKNKLDFSLLSNEESNLIKLLGEYESIVLEASDKLKPSHLTSYIIKISQSYNEIYQKYKIIGEEDNMRNIRLHLSYITSLVIQKALLLIDIDTLNEM